MSIKIWNNREGFCREIILTRSCFYTDPTRINLRRAHARRKKHRSIERLSYMERAEFDPALKRAHGRFDMPESIRIGQRPANLSAT